MSKTTVYVTTEQQLKELVIDCRNQSLIGIDTEFNNLLTHKSTLLLVSIATEHYRYVIDVVKLGNEVVFRYIGPIIEDERIIKVGHNLIAEYKQFLHHGKVEMRGVFDTLLADKLIYAGLDKQSALNDVLLRELNVTMDKTVREEFITWQPGDTFNSEQIEYSALDVEYLHKLYEIQTKKLADRQLDEKIVDLEMDMIAPVATMEYTGVPIQQEVLQELVQPFEKLIKAADQVFQDMLIEAGAADVIVFDRDGYHTINSSSTEQVKEALAKIGIKITDKAGKLTLESKSVQRWDLKHSGRKDRHAKIDYYAIMDDMEVADALEHYELLNNRYLRAYAYVNAARKLLSTFVKGLIAATDPDTQRIYPTFRPLGASRTGRFSSSGPNFQNLPNDTKLDLLGLKGKSIRHAIAPKPGRQLVIADYSGIELVILAVLSGDDSLMDQILVGDIHTYVARAVFGITDMTSENKGQQPYKSWRQAAKRVSYSIAYGTTGVNLSEQINIDLARVGVKFTAKEGDEIIDKWFQLFPTTHAYLEGNARKAVTDLYVCDTWGRRRQWDKNKLYFDGTVKDRYWKRLAAEREGKNAPIQGTSATMVKQAIRLLWNKLDRKRARVIICVHDELVLETTQPYAETARQLVKECMEQAIKDTLPAIADKVGLYESLSVDAKLSHRYDK